jgi:hypothetical protein
MKLKYLLVIEVNSQCGRGKCSQEEKYRNFVLFHKCRFVGFADISPISPISTFATFAHFGLEPLGLFTCQPLGLYFVMLFLLIFISASLGVGKIGVKGCVFFEPNVPNEVLTFSFKSLQSSSHRTDLVSADLLQSVSCFLRLQGQ